MISKLDAWLALPGDCAGIVPCMQGAPDRDSKDAGLAPWPLVENDVHERA